jgi:hypothetical protein
MAVARSCNSGSVTMPMRTEGALWKMPGEDIDQLLDLSRYEEPGRDAGDYKARMVENVAAVVLLSVLVAFAAFDVISLEQIQHCASAGGC